MVTYIIRPIRVSNETCRLFHQHARPTVSLLLLIHRVTSHGFSKITPGSRAETFRSARTFKTHYRYDSTPYLLELHCCPPPANQQGCICFFFCHASRRSVMGGTGGWGRRRDSLQQINISTHVSGPSAHRSGWKLLQSFLRRREMVPKPAWGEWNGPEQWRN